MGWESSGMVRFDLGTLFQGQKSIAKAKCASNSLIIGSLLQGQTRIAKLKSAYNLLIIGPRDFGWYTNVLEIMGWESIGVVVFDLGLLLQGQMRIVKLKSAYNSLNIAPRGFGVKPVYRKSFGFPNMNTLNILYYLPTDKLCYKFRCNKSYLLCE